MDENKQEKQKVPFYEKWWFWLIIGVVVIGVIGSIVGRTSDSSSSDNDGTTYGGTTYGLNQTVTVRELEFKITNVCDTKQVGNQYLGQSTENNFVIVTIQIKNNSNSEKYITDSSFRYYRGNNQYESSNAGIYLGDNGFWLNVTIGAGITKTIQVAYEIPSEHQSTDYILVKDSYKSEKIYMK